MNTSTRIIRPESVVSYWNANNIVGTTIYDRKGYRNGTLVNSPSLVPFNIGKGISLDGSTQYINIGNAVGYSFINTSFTISFDIKTTQTGFAYIMYAGYHYGWGIGIYNNYIEADIKSNDRYIIETDGTSGVINDGKLHHIDVVFTTSSTVSSSNTINIYVDGKITTATVTRDTGVVYNGTDGYFAIGCRLIHTPSNYSNDIISNIFVRNVGLSAAEIRTIYNSKK